MVDLTSILCSRLQPQSPPRYGSGTGSTPFPQAPAGDRQIFGGWQRSGWLWCCGRSCWWCSRRMTQRSSPAGSGRGGGGPVREGYKVVALFLKPRLGLFGLVGRRRVLLPQPSSATGYLIAPGDHHTRQHIQVHFGVEFQADLEDVRWHDVAFCSTTSKESSDALSCALKRWTVRICILRVLAMVLLSYLESVESLSCTAVHFRSRSLNIVSLSDMIEGSYRSWDLYTTGQLVDGQQQEKKTSFH